jgi:hypothetical protein
VGPGKWAASGRQMPACAWGMWGPWTELRAYRSRKKEELLAPIEEGHLSWPAVLPDSGNPFLHGHPFRGGNRAAGIPLDKFRRDCDVLWFQAGFNHAVDDHFDHLPP